VRLDPELADLVRRARELGVEQLCKEFYRLGLEECESKSTDA
jgi:hypothetical protein